MRICLEIDVMVCYRKGGCGPYKMLPCNECPASKPEYGTKDRTTRTARKKGWNDMKLKACPLLPQAETTPSLTIAGESYTRTRFLRCLGGECAAFCLKDDGTAQCLRFMQTVSLTEADG